MNIYEITVSAIPNQILNTVLGEQNCTIHIYQRGEYMYLDLSVDDTDIILGRICLSQITIESNKLNGYLVFNDEQGKGDIPNYKELGTRYKLYYVL